MASMTTTVSPCATCWPGVTSMALMRPGMAAVMRGEAAGAWREAWLGRATRGVTAKDQVAAGAERWTWPGPTRAA